MVNGHYILFYKSKYNKLTPILLIHFGHPTHAQAGILSEWHTSNGSSIASFAPPPSLPNPIEALFFSFKEGERKIKEMGGKKNIRISTTIKQLLLTV